MPVKAFSLAVVFLFMLAACQTDNELTFATYDAEDIEDLSSFSDKEDTIRDTSTYDYYPDDQLIIQGKTQLRERNFGKAYSIFKKAVNVNPKDPEAWLGYAAASDHIRRFDNADRAYRKLSGMIGHRPEYYNNVGYSYLLRGNLRQARRYFLKAYEIDPGNEHTANNIELLRNSVQYVKRGPNHQKAL
ncbi:MAG: tetratricopeptide repeat protein [Rhizobiaceae bacterium]